MTKRAFYALLSAIGIVVVATIVIILSVQGTKSDDSSSSAEHEDPGKKVDTSKISTLPADTIWSKASFQGSETAEHKLVVYADLFCPYCRKEYEAIEQNMDDFKATFLDTGLLSYELRLVDALNDPTDPEETYISTTGGEVVYCAAEQDKFWEYYQAIQDKIYDDYYSKKLGDRHYDRTTEPDWKEHSLPYLDTEYFTSITTNPEVDLDQAKLDTCLESGSGMLKMKQALLSAQKVKVSSFPSFVLDGKTQKSLYSIDNTYNYDIFYSKFKAGLLALIG
jgi:protein-disulfide isomerase